MKTPNGQPLVFQIRFLKGDSEKAFNSADSRRYYAACNIKFTTINVAREGHTSMAPIDRFIRTLRDMNHNLQLSTGRPLQDLITPETMQNLLRNYNNAPHDGLTKIMKFPVTPADVFNDENLEREIITRINRMNYDIIHSSGFLLEPNVNVVVQNVVGTLEKKRGQVKPQPWVVRGFERGRYTISNGNEIRRVPRFMVA